MKAFKQFLLIAVVVIALFQAGVGGLRDMFGSRLNMVGTMRLSYCYLPSWLRLPYNL